MRLLLYLDSIQFFGAMIVILKVMMKESLIFFALLSVIVVGFLQAFIGLDNADNQQDVCRSSRQNTPLIIIGYNFHSTSDGKCSNAIT
jgi:hypothetical protein